MSLLHGALCMFRLTNKNEVVCSRWAPQISYMVVVLLLFVQRDFFLEELADFTSE